MKKVTVIGLLVAMLAMFSGSALAEGHTPVLTVTPGSVEAAGPQTVTLSGEDFTPGNSIFILPCAGAEGDLANLTPDNTQEVCDIGALTPVVIGDDGTFSVEIEYDIPAEGLVIAGGDAGGVDGSSTVISVGAAGDAAEEAPAEEEATEDAAPAAESGDLAKTGVETPLMVGLGTALLGAGFIATRAGRRLGDR